MDQKWKLIGDKLPKQPCADLVNEITCEIYDTNGTLGDTLILYNRESIVQKEPMADLMTWEDIDRRERTAKRRWGARCTCTNCREEFVSGYIADKRQKGIVLDVGPDGQVYTGYSEVADGGTPYLDGDTIQCPFCYYYGVITRRSELRSGRTYQEMQAEVVNVEQYTVLMYWLVSRHIDYTGTDFLHFLPHSALLVDLDGKLRRFRAKRNSAELLDVNWIPCAQSRDPMQMTYYSWESANERKIGGWTLAYGPSLDGHTGEKTALDKYIGAGGCWPGAYLHVWQQHPQVENLMRNGLCKAVVCAIDNTLNCASYYYDLCDSPHISWVDWSEKKPHKMLHMTKTAFLEISAAEWDDMTAECWDKYRRLIPDADAMDFELCRGKIKVGGIDQLLNMVDAGWSDIQPVPVVRYLEKQGLLDDGVQHLIDYRKMLQNMETPETAETMWPKDLMTAHERLTQAWAACHHTEYELGFTSTYIRYRALEWSDGELCIVIPQNAQALVDEGNTLRHCVGGYSKEHCSGKPIFFVRHFRRPERSYYTLQIDMTGQSPREIQLHGYGNERHGPHKEYCHKLPAKVRKFCDRWEKEVLQKWFASQRRRQNTTATKKEEGAA